MDKSRYQQQRHGGPPAAVLWESCEGYEAQLSAESFEASGSQPWLDGLEYLGSFFKI